MKTEGIGVEIMQVRGVLDGERDINGMRDLIPVIYLSVRFVRAKLGAL